MKRETIRKKISSLTAKFAALLVAFACAGSAWGATTVAKIGDTEYRSLQDAVNKVTTGQTIRLVANCDETALVARIVSFTLVQDEGVEFTGSIAQGSQETQIATAEGENGGTVYTMTQPNRSYTDFTTVNNANTYDPLILAYVKKEWEKTQTGVFIAGRKVTASGTYDGEGYRDAAGKVSVDLASHVITLNNATITASSEPVTTYTRVSTVRNPGTSVEKVLHNEVPYDGVVCIEEMTYNVPSSSAERGNSAGFCYWPIGYNKGSGLMATVGLAILDDENEWQVVLIGENKIVVNAGFVCPTSTGNVPNLTESGDGYGIYAKGTLTVKGAGSLDANVKNSGVSDYDYFINPGTAGVFAQNLTISETTIAATVEGVEATMSMGGMSVTMATGSKYGAVYASGTLTIEDSAVAATNKMSLGRNGWVGTSGAAIGSTGGAVTISGGTVEAQHIATGYGYDEEYNLVSGAVGVGIAATGSASGTVTITGGANVSVEASTGGISGYKGITVNGPKTELSIDTTGVGLESTAGPYQISQAAVTIENAETSLEYTSRNAGSSISTGDYAANVPAEAIATGTYQYFSQGMYHITDTIPTGWVAFCNNTFFMDAGSSAEAIAVCEEGGEVYINEDSAAAKTGITQGGSFTVYVLEGKSYTGAVTTDRLKSEKTTSDTTTFDGKTYIPNIYTMVVDPERAVAKTVKADGTETYFATLAFSSTYTPPARNDVGEGGTLVLLEDVNLSDLYATINFSLINWTLDLNGCKLTCGSNYYVSQSMANYTLTIKDSSAAQTGVIHQTYVPSNNSSAGSGVRCSNGTIVIESGRFTGGNTPVVATGSGVIEIRGGYFEGALYVDRYSPGTYVCYGGTYTVDPVRHVAEGYAAAKTVVDETDLWVVGRLDITKTVTPVSDVSAEYVISASIYDADDNLITKLAEDQTIAVNIDTTKDVAGSTLAKFDAEKVVTTALLNAEDSSKITAIAISVQSAMTNKVESINNSTKERLGTAVYYDVKPVAEVAAAGADSTAFTIANDAIADGAEFAFDLVLPEIEGVEAGTPLYIAHISSDYDNELSYDVAREGDGGTLYVAVSTTHFSTFRVNYSTTSETAVLMTFYGNNTPTYVSYTETSLATAVSNVGRYSSVGTVVLLADIVLDAPVSMTKPARNETIVDLNDHTITLAEGVENAFVLSGEGTMLTVKNGTVPVGISGYPENYVLVATAADGATTYKAAAAVAQIGTTKYETLDAAIDAAGSSGTTITLLDDAELGVDTIAKSFKIESNGRKITLSNDVTLNTGKTIIAFTDLTIDLAGHAISASGTGKIQCGEYYHKVSTLTIEDSATGGKITGGNYSSAPLTQYGNGSVIMLKDDVAVNGTYIGITSGGGQIIVNDSATVYGGTYGVKNTATSDGVTDLYYSGNTVSGGTLAAWGPAEATIGGKTYYAKTVSGLVSKVPSDGTEYTITAHNSDATLSGTVVQGGQRIVVDLGSCVSSLRDDVKIYEGHLTIRNGTVNYGSQDRLIMLYSSADDTKNAGEYNSLTIADDAKITTTVVVYPSGYNTSSESGKAYGTKVVVNGEIVGTGSGAISINGVAHEGNSVIEVNGTVTNDKGLAIYLAGHGATYINASATVSGTTGIEVRAGELNVAGGSIAGTGASAINVANNSGASTSGAGIAVAQHTTQLPISVNVSGGTITGASSLYVVNPQGNTSDNAIDVSVSGNAAFSGEVVVTDARADVEIVGGLFSADPSAYVADGYAAVELTEGVAYNAGYRYAVGKVVASDLVPAAGATETEATYNFSVVVTNETGKIGTLATEQTVTVRVDDEHSIADITLNDFDISDVLASAVSAVGTGNENVTVDLRVSSAAVSGGKVTFEAHPEAVIQVGTATPEVVTLTNDELADGATFSLKFYTGESFAVGTLVKITHKSADYEDEVFIASVAEDTAGRYVPVTVSHFSTFEIEPFTPDAGMVAVNKNTGAQYATLEAAVAAASAGDTVMLLADIDLGSHARNAHDDIVLEGITLDLNGKTIRGFNNGVRYSGSNAVIKNGTFDFVAAEATPSYALSIGSWTDGVAKSTGMQLENLTVNGGINVDNADVTLTDVTINQGAGAYYCLWVDEDNNASATFVSGTINAGANATAVFGVAKASSGTTTDGTLNVQGGTINANGEKLVLASGNHIQVSGGSFDVAVPEADCATGFIPKDNGDGTYGVKAGAYVAQIGETKYESLAEAFAAAQSGNTIRMTADSAETVGSTLASGKSVVLDLNGKAVSYTSAFSAAFNLIAVNGTLTVTDTSADADGSIALVSTANLSWDYAVNMFIVGNGGSLTIEKGSYSVTTPSYGYAEYIIAASNNNGASTVVVNGGTFTGNNIDAVVRLHDQRGRSQPLNVTVNGGDFTLNGSQCDSVIWFDVQNSNNGTDNASVANLVINGGTFTSTSTSPALDLGHDVDASGLRVTVAGGAFKSNGAVIKTRNLSAAAIANIQLSGGIYSGNEYYNDLTKETAALDGLCADGYVVTGNTDAQTMAAYPYTVAFAGDIIYPIEGTAGVRIALAWATNNTSVVSEGAPVTAADVPNIITALRENGANNMPKWESYVLGLNPADPTAVLRLTATAKNATTVTVTGSIDTTKFPSISNVTVTFRLAAQNGAEWTDIATGAASPSFNVALDDVAGKVLTIFADIVTE